MITFNPNIKLAIADVDDTITVPYVQATAEIVVSLNQFLADGRSLYLVSGGGLQSIIELVTNLLDPKLRQRILIAHCSGAEVWGFEKGGELRQHPFYSLYSERITEKNKILWRTMVEELEEEFGLKVYPTMPSADFTKHTLGDKKSIMKADRGPQITWECVNDPDLREDLIPKVKEMIAKYELPLEVRKGGIFALDFILKGVSKDTAVKYVMDSDAILHTIGLSKNGLKPYEYTIETWGDRYMEGKGSDHHMSLALPRNVRSIDFRKDEDPKHFPQGYNIVLWDGAESLCEGLLEYLQTNTTSK